MRGLGTVIGAAIVAGLVAGVLQVQLAISFNAHEEFIGVMFGQVLFILIATILFAVAVTIFETTSAVDRVGFGLAGVLIAGVVGVEGYAAIALNNRISPAAMVAEDGPIVLEIVAPALLATLVQWWLVRRHVQKKQRLAEAA
ncbi:hypothetical protein BH10PSE9_BH10PSE9_18440 [soil metagenome]